MIPAHLGPLFICGCIFAHGFDFAEIFAYLFDFAEIFAYLKNSALSMTPHNFFLYDSAGSELFSPNFRKLLKE